MRHVHFDSPTATNRLESVSLKRHATYNADNRDVIDLEVATGVVAPQTFGK